MGTHGSWRVGRNHREEEAWESELTERHIYPRFTLNICGTDPNSTLNALRTQSWQKPSPSMPAGQPCHGFESGAGIRTTAKRRARAQGRNLTELTGGSNSQFYLWTYSHRGLQQDLESSNIIFKVSTVWSKMAHFTKNKQKLNNASKKVQLMHANPARPHIYKL